MLPPRTVMHLAGSPELSSYVLTLSSTPHLIRREGEAERRQSLALWDILNLCMNEIGHRNHTSNPAPPLSVNCAAGVILPYSPVL